ncbi:trypsin-like peptidase domain-containing protein [Polynucleobacter paneuropaeus]|uniref:2-alkenal reductase n=1 Tax=Polynucleobacter paneuropaeus TaxID=2527775 RepID=A0A2Z4JQC2_9BURK|nr:trypsin-like peptidase domain-containing protein [Polynucleobacter paneuropaeus]AWW49011.1 2-alkenal reductase [Polynucleobacter paneuropaeus]
MLNRLWLLFAQAVTILIAVWFVLITLKPEWLAGANVTTIVDSVTLKERDDVSSPNPGSYHEAVKKSMPAVVNIFTSKSTKQPLARKDKNKKSDPFNQFFFGDTPDAEPISSLGSGVIVSPEGVILTNHHVIRDADDIDIALYDGRKYKAKIIGSDPETDIAVLKIDAKQLPNPITLGNVNSVHVGDVVLAIGNPFGVGETVTSGIVSAMGRDHVGINTFENFIQTDAAINPGNSGGALIDTRGNLIGINTAIYSNNGGSMGIGFAIPINLVKQVMQSILKTGGVTRGWIGIEPQNLSHELINLMRLPKNTEGILVSAVLEGGPADRGGMNPKDIILEVNNVTVRDIGDLLNKVSELNPGDAVDFKLIRNSKELNLSFRIGKRPKQKT